MARGGEIRAVDDFDLEVYEGETFVLLGPNGAGKTTTVHLLTNTGVMALFVASNIVFVLGLFLLNPAFSPRSVRLWLNVMMTVLSSVGLFALGLFLFTRGFPPELLSDLLESYGGILYVELIQISLSWLVAIVLLYLGERKLDRTEEISLPFESG